jgi:hypothetical protein
MPMLIRDCNPGIPAFFPIPKSRDWKTGLELQSLVHYPHLAYKVPTAVNRQSEPERRSGPINFQLEMRMLETEWEEALRHFLFDHLEGQAGLHSPQIGRVISLICSFRVTSPAHW